MRKMIYTIDLGKEYSRILTSRNIITEIEVKYGNKVILDFRDIDFISRSFAHELLLYMRRNPQVKIINTTSEVQKMLRAVKKSLDKEQRTSKLNISRENILSVIGH